jgi:hypothetical protein
MKKSLKALGIAAGVGTVLSVAGSPSAAIFEHANFQAAVRSGSPSAMQRFLEMHPTGQYSERILKILHDRLSIQDDLLLLAAHTSSGTTSSSSGGSSSGTSSSGGTSSGSPSPGRSSFGQSSGNSSGNSNGLGNLHGNSSGNPYH